MFLRTKLIRICLKCFYVVCFIFNSTEKTEERQLLLIIKTIELIISLTSHKTRWFKDVSTVPIV